MGLSRGTRRNAKEETHTMCRVSELSMLCGVVCEFFASKNKKKRRSI